MARGPRRIALRRVCADAIDAALGVVLGLIASLTPVGWFFATRAVVMLHIGQPDTIWRGPIPFLMGVAGTFVYALPCAMLLVMLCEPLLGTSPGKAMLRLGLARVDGGAPSPRQLWLRMLAKASPWWIWTMGLVSGSWVLAIAGSVAAALVLGDVIIAALCATDPVYDRWTGTKVTDAST